jgi:O-antigen ligase
MLNNFPPKWLQIPHREDNVFSIVFFVCLILPLLFIPIFPEGYETVKYAVLVIMSGLGFLVLLQRQQIYIHKLTLVLLGIFWALHLLATIFSIDVINSVVGLYGRYTGSMVFVTSWILLIILIWNAVSQSESRRLTLLRVIAFDGLAVAVLGIFQYFDLAYYGGTNPGVRPIIPSFIGNQNFYAMFLVAALPATALLWREAKNRLAGYYYIIAGLIGLWALVLSGSRGGLLGFGAMASVFLLMAMLRKYPKQFWVIAAGSIVVVGVLYFGFFSLTRSDSANGVSANAQYTAQTRYIIWTDSLKLIANNPLLGTGSGNFFIAFERLGNVALSGNERFDDAHNIALNMAVSVGLPALAVFLWLLGLTALLAWRESKFAGLSSIWSVSSLAGILVAASFNPVSSPTWLLLALIIAFGSSYVSVQREVFSKLGYKVLALLLSAAILLFGLCFIASETFSVYGLRAYRRDDSVKAEKYFQPALTLNPFNSTARVYLTGSKIKLQEDFEKRKQDIQTIVNQHPNSSGTYNNAASLTYMLYRQTNDEADKQRMNAYYESSIDLEPNASNLYGAAAYGFYKTGQTDKAVEYLNRQLSLPDNKDFPYSWILLSKIYLEKGDREASIAAMEKAYAQMTDQILIKFFLKQMRETTDLKTVNFPVAFPDIDV